MVQHTTYLVLYCITRVPIATGRCGHNTQGGSREQRTTYTSSTNRTDWAKTTVNQSERTNNTQATSYERVQPRTRVSIALGR